MRSMSSSELHLFVFEGVRAESDDKLNTSTPRLLEKKLPNILYLGLLVICCWLMTFYYNHIKTVLFDKKIPKWEISCIFANVFFSKKRILKIVNNNY